MIISILAIGCSAAVLHISYRKYYKRMKSHHPNEWRKLMNQDPMIEAAGEWIRWPLGSIHIIKTVFSRAEYYDDNMIMVYKKRSIASFAIFLASFVLFLVIAATLPK